MQRQFLYWVPEESFEPSREFLAATGFRVRAAALTPCEVMKAAGDTVLYASPAVWSRMCTRQSSWYQTSRRAGQYMFMSAKPLPEELGAFLDAELTGTDFLPERLPSRDELVAIVADDAYQSRKPDAWEGIRWLDAVLFKLLFTVTRFWRRGDNLARHWLGHRANHANFLARHFTTSWDGEDVAYSVTDNASVCSSCAEFFNVVEDRSRKLVRSCPGSVVFGGAPRDVYVDVRPV